jgi:hypothetical protein
MTMTGGLDRTAADVAGGFELDSPETRSNGKSKHKARNEGSICSTVTGNYISTDETDKTKVAQKRED